MDVDQPTKPRRARTWAERWERDAAFRRRASAALAVVAIFSMTCCVLSALFIAHQLFPAAAQPILVGGGDRAFGDVHPTYTVAVAATQESASWPTPMAVATTTQMPPTPTNPPGTPTPTVGIPTPSPTAGTLTCPSIDPAPPLAGFHIRDGISPAPLIAGCPATLVIDAPQQPQALVSVTLTFANANPGACTVRSATVWTDAHGHAVVPFVVPGTYCVRGTILTNGTILVGGDASANASFPASN